MLRNDNGLLPLPKSGKKIALIGPFGADTKNLNGAWSPFSAETPSIPVDVAFRKALKDPSLLNVVKGCDIEAPFVQLEE